MDHRVSLFYSQARLRAAGFSDEAVPCKSCFRRTLNLVSIWHEMQSKLNLTGSVWFDNIGFAMLEAKRHAKDGRNRYRSNSVKLY